MCGKLPWSEAAKIKDKGKVATLKKQYLADPRRFVEWVKHQAEDADRIKVSHIGFEIERWSVGRQRGRDGVVRG